VQEIRKSVSTSDPLKISILSGLLVIDELFRERSRDDGASDSDRDSDEGTRVPHSDPEEVARITDELIEKLNETLQATESHAQAGEHGHGEADTEGDPEDEADTDSERPS
jgi:cell division protein ZapA (FtsZ GTPase activity inhibitor)